MNPTIGTDMLTLTPGDLVPSLTVTPPDASPLSLPEAFREHVAVVLFFRGV